MLTQDTTGIDFLNARDQSFKYEVGWRIYGMIQPDARHAVEVSYMELDNDSAGFVVTDNVAQPLIFQPAGAAALNSNQFYRYYKTELDTGEVNLVAPIENGDTSFLLGVRWLAMDERFLLDSGPFLGDCPCGAVSRIARCQLCDRCCAAGGRRVDLRVPPGFLKT